MRRMTSFRKSIIVYLSVLVVLMYLFFRYGLQLFIDTAFYLSGSRKETTNVVKTTKNGTLSDINIDPLLLDVPHATNTAEIDVTGKVKGDSPVHLYQDNSRVDTVKSDLEGKVTFTIKLHTGTNNIYIKSEDSYTHNSADSPVYTIVYKDKKPTLDISDPTDGKRVYQSDVLLQGKTDDEVFVTVNGMAVVVKADGSFAQPLSLKKGDNTIVIHAQDIAGNTTDKNLTVTLVE